ncbi:hypothetical protein cyc_01939 [Cyclospora cayetanensis]|uniref:Uncharacterized protein n=1 Tax=Cyclospora cayetanensis TaxID=88456 RepID=A0A1D3CVQ3_9EIME|nr:hypothetical protein cyc_01939 [Cyclospora cayetanensis]
MHSSLGIQAAAPCLRTLCSLPVSAPACACPSAPSTAKCLENLWRIAPTTAGLSACSLRPYQASLYTRLQAPLLLGDTATGTVNRSRSLSTAASVICLQNAPRRAHRGALEREKVYLGNPLMMRAPLRVQTRAYFFLPGPLKLEDVVKLPLLRLNPRKKVVDIWLSRFLSQPLRHAAFLTRAQYEALETNSRCAPLFVAPLPRGPGAFEVLLAQFQRNCCLFVSLEQYKQSPNKASPLLTLTFYPELKESHDLVLLKADILSPTVLRPPEAAHLTRVIVESYADANRFQWPKAFNFTPDKFSFEAFKDANPDFFAHPLPEIEPPPETGKTDKTLWLPGAPMT